jgi:hypothetical protein
LNKCQHREETSHVCGSPEEREREILKKRPGATGPVVKLMILHIEKKKKLYIYISIFIGPARAIGE